MKLYKIRSAAYFVGRVLGDVSAVQNGTIGKRIVRRGLGKISGRLIVKIVK